jgi:hypothetical protein
MGRARVVAPPPENHIPEPLVPPPTPPEEVVAEEWIEGNLQEEITEEIICLRHDLERQMTIANEHVNENEKLREENQRLIREKEAAEKAREDQIVKMRQKATDQKGSKLNMVEARKPSLLSRLKDFLRRRRIQLATVPRANYEQAIIHQASVAVPKMLDEIEKMHESLTILEELLAKQNERQKINRSEKHPRR